MPTPKARQTRADREYIIDNLPDGTKRVQVVTAQGKQQYKRPEDIDLDHDEIMLASDGTPVVMRGKPGRRPKAQLNPVTPQIDEIVRAKQDHLDSDLLVREVQRDSNGDQVLDQVLFGMALEAASIEFERMEAERHGQDTVNISAKRVRALKSMADTVLKKKQIAAGGMIDLDSPVFRALFTLMLGTFKGAMTQAGARPELVETTFTNLVKALEDPGWKEDARQKMKEKLL
jgi:hypothetical protein